MNIQWACDMLRKIHQAGYTGKIEINFFKGGISAINCAQTFKNGESVRVLEVLEVTV